MAREMKPCIEGKEHCLHKSDWQHTVAVMGGAHTDIFCCWCGQEECKVTSDATLGEHGKYCVPKPKLV
jgi:hypothetical protein